MSAALTLVSGTPMKFNAERGSVEPLEFQKRGNLYDSLIGSSTEKPTVEKYDDKTWTYRDKLQAVPYDHQPHGPLPADRRRFEEIVFTQPLASDHHTPEYLNRKINNALNKKKILNEENVPAMRAEADKNRLKGEQDFNAAHYHQKKARRASKKQEIWQHQRDGEIGAIGNYGMFEQPPERPIEHSEDKYLKAARFHDERADLFPDAVLLGNPKAVHHLNKQIQNRQRLSAIRTGDREMHDKIITQYKLKELEQNILKDNLDNKSYRHYQKAKGWDQMADEVEAKRNEELLSKKRKKEELEQHMATLPDLPDAKRQAIFSDKEGKQ